MTKHTGTVEEAAEVLHIGRSAAYEAAKQGEIPTVRIGRRVIVLWGPLMKMIRADQEGEGAA